MPTYEWYELSPLARFCFARLLPLFFVILGVCALAYGIYTFRTGNASRTWPTVKGVVTLSNVNGTSGHYSLSINYKYDVNGATYTNGRVFYGAISSGGSSEARGLSRRYPAHSTVTVHYKPRSPQTAVLEPGVRNPVVVGAVAVFGAVFLVAGLVLIVVLPRSARKSIAQHAASETGANARAI